MKILWDIVRILLVAGSLALVVFVLNIDEVLSSPSFYVASESYVHQAQSVNVINKLGYGLANVFKLEKEVLLQAFANCVTKEENGRNGQLLGTRLPENKCAVWFIPSTDIWTGQQGERTYGFLIEDEADVEEALASVMNQYPKTVVFFSRNALDINPSELCEPYEITHGLHNRDSAICYNFNWYKAKTYYEYRLDLHYSPAGIVRMYREGILSSLPKKEDLFCYPKEADYTLLLDVAQQIETEYGLHANSSEYEKVLAIYQYITKNFQYDDEMAELSVEEIVNYLGDMPYPEEINFALKNQKAICSGYKRLFQALCYIFDIDCYTATGCVLFMEEWHGWNIVKVDDQRYQADATWDAGLSLEQYRFFLRSDAYMENSRIEAELYYQTPYCPSDYAG